MLKLKKSNSIKFTWIITYITLFLLPVFIYIAIFVVIDGRIKDEANKSNYILLKHVQQYMDSLVSDVENLSIDLAFNDRVQKVRGLEGTISDQDRFKLLELYKDERGKLYNNSIQEVYIFFKKIDTVVSSNNIMDSDTFFKMFCSNNDIDLNEWIDVNNTIHRGEYINLKSKNKNSSKKLAYIMSIPNNTNIDGSASIVVIIDKSKFLAMAEDIEYLNRGNVAILNSKNEIILSSEDAGYYNNLKYENLRNQSGVEYGNINKKNVAISYINAKTKDWKYIYYMPVSEYWSTLEQARKIINFGLFVSIVIGCFAIYLLFKKNYKPVNQLLNSLADFTHRPLGEEKNEFNIIREEMIKSFNEKKQIDTWLSAQKEVFMYKYIERLLRYSMVEEELNDKNIFNISFKWDNYAVMSFYIEDYEKFSQGICSNKLEAFKLLQFVIHNMLEELILDKGTVYTIDMDNKIVTLLNLTSSDTDMVNYLKDIGNKVQEMLKRHYHVDIMIVMSNIYTEMNLINKAYMETVELLELGEGIEGEGILIYNEINKSQEHRYYYPIEYEQSLINVVKAADYKKATVLIEDVFDKNLNKQMVSNSIVKCLKFNTIGTMTNIVNELESIYGEEYFKYLVPIENIIHEKNIKKVKEALYIILKDICDRIEIDKKSVGQIGNKIMKYIMENYKDDNLNLSVIAQEFKMNSAYLSRQFKAQAGYGILDYINKIRIEEAKKLLKDDNENLDNIARRVGYGNVRTFTRAFVKIEGITPGKYKEITP